MTTLGFSRFILNKPMRSLTDAPDEAAAIDAAHLISANLIYRLYESLVANDYDTDATTRHLEMLYDTDNHYGLLCFIFIVSGGRQRNCASASAVPSSKRHDPAYEDGQQGQEADNPSLKTDGVVLTLADMHTNLARATAEALRQQYGGMLKIYKTQNSLSQSGCS